ncbi:MAG: rRNA maturation RNase YbeY [Candidatus Caldatribacteriota bacterium]|nr:rRNA maturation RNase YbeY [Atribacterota bacterium]MDD3030781.1 rRNA maturation RNase YbeY [Atribacterota bacterium]MDD3640167.1 rRNA maturation RNase YbeY [Atribacterota bacterium]MDD4288293.1 rRNA maturation RNase YbeY [Atribacterota bacterium]MDD5635599.1 rRNA maturation RNase YbeY [Atribacterota bacterium]
MIVRIKNKQKKKLNFQIIEKILITAMEVMEIKKNSEVSLLLTSDREIQYLNKVYRDKDTPTDVLSFSMSEGLDSFTDNDEIDDFLLGDIVISIETAQRNAELAEISLMQEINILITHGLLHLLGYDHNSDEEFDKMKNEEDRILKITDKILKD